MRAAALGGADDVDDDGDRLALRCLFGHVVGRRDTDQNAGSDLVTLQRIGEAGQLVRRDDDRAGAVVPGGELGLLGRVRGLHDLDHQRLAEIGTVTGDQDIGRRGLDRGRRRRELDRRGFDAVAGDSRQVGGQVRDWGT